MATLVYSLGVSLDGFVEDETGAFDWSAPDAEVHRLANAQAQAAQAFLFGRRMYETMEPYWPGAVDAEEPIEREFARAYVARPRIVFSDTLDEVGAGCRLVRSADARAEIARLKRQPGGHLDLGGATLAASVVDLIDEFRMWVVPVVVGAGKRYLPPQRLDLRLLESRTFASGTLWLRYGRRS
ncbi:dihydrofolate reductase family protein [Patulibacter sp. SYSU D01012]|uniref:dihydrofolate reductase family protein n=1 Tax=Patulibacter sp. SYSU D01012 TaxID=2817381 RepID=UPI001B309326|nr:dihydrofolate reductase family protein [Patulibacter sp. SYSU D01012]